MNTKTRAFMLTGLIMSILSGASVQAADVQPQMTEEMQAHMAKAKEAGAPGANHAILKPLEGEWTVTGLSWMKPNDKPQQSVGTSSLAWILDGRFLKQTFKGEWAGQPFEGLGFIGYDNLKKEYISVWMDNVSTGIFKATGRYDAATKTIKETGSFSCPMTGEKDMWFRSEWKIAGKNRHVYSMYIKDPAGKEFKSMELTYKRVK